jgi:hypothetical protein
MRALEPDPMAQEIAKEEPRLDRVGVHHAVQDR